MEPPPTSRIQYNSTIPQFPSCSFSLSFSLHTPSPWETTDVFADPKSFAFSRIPYKWNHTVYIAFWIRLLSFITFVLLCCQWISNMTISLFYRLGSQRSFAQDQTAIKLVQILDLFKKYKERSGNIIWGWVLNNSKDNHKELGMPNLTMQLLTPYHPSIRYVFSFFSYRVLLHELRTAPY